MSTLESAIASVFASQLRDLTDSIRSLKQSGASKSEVVQRITLATKGRPFVRSGLLITVDEIWKEPSVAGEGGGKK